MAELATAGSLVGLISLSIQSCQGLVSYYSAWKSYDEQIGHTHRDLDELRTTCETLERELQRITQYQELAFQQVVRLITSCQDGINALRHALEQCHSVQIPHTLAAKFELYRARALYPFRKQTLKTLEDNVHNVQGNLSSALQVLQLHLSAGHEQSLALLVRTASGTETAVQDNRIAIQALLSPLQTIGQAIPLIQERSEDTAITTRTIRDEARDSRQQAREFREKALLELTKVADGVNSSPGSLERTMVVTLNRHSTEMTELINNIHSAQSQTTAEMAAKLETLDQSIKGLQVGLISKPGLMQLVCRENNRVENLPGSNNERREDWLGSTDDRRKRRQRCTCKLKHNNTYTEIRPNSTWKIVFERECINHHRTCPLFASPAKTTTAKIRIRTCGAFLAGAVEASISLIRGAGGSSISAALQCARVVPRNSPAFSLVHLDYVSGSVFPTFNGRAITSPRKLKAHREFNIHQLARMFRDGRASPYDVDLDGNTLLHVASNKWPIFFHFYYYYLYSAVSESAAALSEFIVSSLIGLEELCVPLNWTNDSNLTFMNYFALETFSRLDPLDFATSTTRLLDTGAEFGNFRKSERITDLPIWMAKYADCAEFVDFLEDNELSVAIWHRSGKELDEALRKWPQLINQTNWLGSTPLHLAVCWPYSVRELLKHGACLDAFDKDGRAPLYYAIELGSSETVSVLMKAGCSLCSYEWVYQASFQQVCREFNGGGFDRWVISQDTRKDVLDTFVSMLAERRRNLQSRLATISKSFKVDAGVFRGDRILDEYAEYAETIEKDALSEFNSSPLYVSTLLEGCRTVYHVRELRADIAEKLWQQGFRDIDVPDKYGLTPLMRNRDNNLIHEINVCFWLIQKGAKLHRPQHRPLEYDSDPTLSSLELPPVTRALHHVAAEVGLALRDLAYEELQGATERLLENQLNQLSKGARLLPETILLDVSHDDCICACSSRGCLVSTMMLKSTRDPFSGYHEPRMLPLATEYLIILIGPSNPCPDWLVKEIIRYRTFKQLGLRHTCCHCDEFARMTKLDPEERAEIRDEDQEKIELLESLLLEFEEHRGTQDVLSFLEGYWAKRMDQVHQEQGCVDEEALREIGVVLQKDDTKRRGWRRIDRD